MLFGFNLEEIVFWHWWVFAGALFVLEVLSLSFFFLWLGASAFLIGVIMLLIPEISWQLQFSLWAGIAVVDVAAWRIYKKKNSGTNETDEPALNKRGQQYVGRTLTLEKPIVNGFGKVKVDDSIWKVEAESDIDAGEKVRVTAIDGTILQVEAAD